MLDECNVARIPYAVLLLSLLLLLLLLLIFEHTLKYVSKLCVHAV